MERLDRSDLATRRLRVILDSAWQLQNHYPSGALACLLGEINQTYREESQPSEGRNIK